MKNIILIFFVFGAHMTMAQWNHVNVPSIYHNYYCTFGDFYHGIVMSETQLWKTNDGGGHWLTLTPNRAVYTPYMLSADTVIAPGDSGIYKSTDGGTSWTLVSSWPAGVDSTFYGVPACFLPDHQTGFIVISSAFSFPNPNYVLFVLRTLDGGDTWNTCFTDSAPFTVPSNWHKIEFATSLDGFMNLGGDLWKTNDGGNTWTIATSLYGISAYGVASKDTLYINEQSSNQLLGSYDNGQNWSPVATPNGAIMYDIKFRDKMNGFICGGNGISNGYIMATHDGGVTWQQDFADSHTYHYFSIPDPTIGFVCGEDGTVLKKDFGTGVGEVINNDFSIYPNPAHSTVHVTISSSSGKINYELRNLLGEIIFTSRSESNSFDLNVNNFSPGIYLLKVKTKSGEATQKLIIN